MRGSTKKKVTKNCGVIMDMNIILNKDYIFFLYLHLCLIVQPETNREKIQSSIILLKQNNDIQNILQ